MEIRVAFLFCIITSLIRIQIDTHWVRMEHLTKEQLNEDIQMLLACQKQCSVANHIQCNRSTTSRFHQKMWQKKAPLMIVSDLVSQVKWMHRQILAITNQGLWNRRLTARNMLDQPQRQHIHASIQLMHNRLGGSGLAASKPFKGMANKDFPLQNFTAEICTTEICIKKLSKMGNARIMKRNCYADMCFWDWWKLFITAVSSHTSKM